jgi:hypothetical protein
VAKGPDARSRTRPGISDGLAPIAAGGSGLSEEHASARRSHIIDRG